MGHKKIIAEYGRVCDLTFDDTELLIFKTLNKKKFITSFGTKTYLWIKDRFYCNNVALCYKENGITTLIVEV